MKTLYTLIGPKGSGKTYIGSLLDKELHIPFLNVETAVWLHIVPQDMSDAYFRKGFSKVEEEIHRQFVHTDKLIVDSVGTSPYFVALLDHIRSMYQVKFIKVVAPLNLCIDRIHRRDETLHVPMTEEQIKTMNAQEPLIKNYDLVIINDHILDKEIITEFKTLL